ncbi:MAG: hypothetical protein IPQ14_00025 [Candidatus Microthrix sp.]|uniref:RCC1 domain-containing protein n=1 Tax=Candidatus Neomicrothrix sp. TaxID=2719034 RepID=UPI0025BA9CC4|nr:hypothetical protein [Candidatus Microthrix sp.]MBL0202743.1 hypothetical protein [Candidatus Microthrix sp.]
MAPAAVSVHAAPVTGLFGVAIIIAGTHHSCAVKQNTTVACWSYNQYGQLGDGTTTNRVTPTYVVGLSEVTAITVSHYRSCALKQNATVACWGSNWEGRLGDGTTTDRWTPTPVLGL